MQEMTVTKESITVDETFRIDTVNSNDEYLYVDVVGMGTVQIKRQDDGIVVDVFSMHIKDESVATTYAHINDLIEDE